MKEAFKQRSKTSGPYPNCRALTKEIEFINPYKRGHSKSKAKNMGEIQPLGDIICSPPSILLNVLYFYGIL